MPKVLDDQREVDGRRAWSSALNERLRLSGMTKQELSKRVGVSRAQLDKYASGHVTPPGKHLAAFSKALAFDPWDQFSLLGWTTEQDAAQTRRLQAERMRRNIYRDMQALLQLDQEIHDVTPSARLASVLIEDGWIVRQHTTWRGTSAPVPYADVLELYPPRRLAHFVEIEPWNEPRPRDESVSQVLQTAVQGLTHGEAELRAIVKELLGPDRFDEYEVYWAGRSRYASADVSHRLSPNAGTGHVAACPGLVLTVPKWLRRRYPSEVALPLQSTDGREISSIACLGLPYSGVPDLAASTADLLAWGFVGVAMLARQQSRGEVVREFAQREQRLTARLLAEGKDHRARLCTWTYNDPIAIPGSVDMIKDGATAVVHARLTDRAIEEFLMPFWGNSTDRTLDQLFAWRDSCDTANAAYRQQHSSNDWLTIDVDLDARYLGYENESARQDYYQVELFPKVSDWLESQYNVQPIDLKPEDRQALAILAERGGPGYSDAELAADLNITIAAARVRVGNLLAKLNLDNRASLYSYALRRRDWTQAEGMPR